MKTVAVIAAALIAASAGASTSRCRYDQEFQQISERIDEMNRLVHRVHTQLTELRMDNHSLMTLLALAVVALLAVAFVLWRRLVKAESEIAVLRRVRLSSLAVKQR